MVTSDELTANAYLKLRDKVAETLNPHGGANVYTREYAERLIEAGYINIDAVLNLP